MTPRGLRVAKQEEHWSTVNHTKIAAITLRVKHNISQCKVFRFVISEFTGLNLFLPLYISFKLQNKRRNTVRWTELKENQLPEQNNNRNRKHKTPRDSVWTSCRPSSSLRSPSLHCYKPEWKTCGRRQRLETLWAILHLQAISELIISPHWQMVQ